MSDVKNDGTYDDHNNPFIEYPVNTDRMLFVTKDRRYFVMHTMMEAKDKNETAEYVKYPDLLKRLSHKEINHLLKKFGQNWVVKSGFIFY